jgi:hypothetical protein
MPNHRRKARVFSRLKIGKNFQIKQNDVVRRFRQVFPVSRAGVILR